MIFIEVAKQNYELLIINLVNKPPTKTTSKWATHHMEVSCDGRKWGIFALYTS